VPPASLDPNLATQLLERISRGDAAAADELAPLLYGELRRVAERCMARQAEEHTLQPTALVHEAWLRIVSSQGERRFENRVHFVRCAARAMRQVLVDHARRKRARKRGGEERREALDLVLERFAAEAVDVVALNDALERLHGIDPELSRIVELRFFAGLSIEEIARLQSVSERTVLRGWKIARLWLRDALQA
jgi:RNA polymerase sigma factor (TIGR02999 family)